MDDLSTNPQDQIADAITNGTGDGAEGTASVTPDSSGSASAGNEGGNPAWASLKQKLGLNFGAIENDLKEMDKQVQARITSVNQQYAPFKDLLDQGHSLQTIQQALQIAQQINSDPLAFNSKYQQFLQARGLTPQQAAQVAQGQQPTPDGEEDPEDGQKAIDLSNDPMMQRLMQQQQQMAQFLQTQQQQALLAQADAELSTEIEALKTAHPEFSDEDVKDVIGRAAMMAQVTRKVPTLEEAAQQHLALRNRILTQPRPGDSAPRLLPTSGGVPSGDAQRKSLGQLSGQETVDLLAGLVQQSKGR